MRRAAVTSDERRHPDPGEAVPASADVPSDAAPPSSESVDTVAPSAVTTVRSDEARGEADAAGGGEGERDRGRTIALGVLGSLVALGVALIARGPGSTTAAPPAPAAALTTSIAIGVPAPAAREADHDAGRLAPKEADAGAPPRPPPTWRVTALKSDPAVEVTEATLGKRTLDRALAQSGVSKAEVKRLTHALDGIRRIERGQPKDAFVVARDRGKGTVLGFEYVTSPTDVWQAKADEVAPEKRLIVKKLELFVEKRRKVGALALTADLPKAVAAAGLREQAIEDIDEALDGHVDLATLKPGVRMRVVGSEEWVEGTYARFHVEALEYVPKGGAPLRVYHYERDASVEGSRRRMPHPGFYDAKGQQPFRGTFRSPLPLARVTSRFNPKRMHPVLHVVMPHNGIDYGASTGTPVYASAPGTVSTAGDGGPCGNMVQIEHAGGLSTAYCHLSRFAPGLHPGQHVEARELVGYVGKTGRATGPHLHFAVKRGGTFIDPLAIKMDGVRTLPPPDRDAFAKKRAELDAALDAIPLPPADGAAAATPDDDKDEPAGEE